MNNTYVKAVRNKNLEALNAYFNNNKVYFHKLYSIVEEALCYNKELIKNRSYTVLSTTSECFMKYNFCSTYTATHIHTSIFVKETDYYYIFKNFRINKNNFVCTICG